jgi:hypothetical protein
MPSSAIDPNIVSMTAESITTENMSIIVVVDIYFASTSSFSSFFYYRCSAAAIYDAACPSTTANISWYKSNCYPKNILKHTINHHITKNM